jgi:hypothetical protein
MNAARTLPRESHVAREKFDPAPFTHSFTDLRQVHSEQVTRRVPLTAITLSVIITVLPLTAALSCLFAIQAAFRVTELDYSHHFPSFTPSLSHPSLSSRLSVQHRPQSVSCFVLSGQPSHRRFRQLLSTPRALSRNSHRRGRPPLAPVKWRSLHVGQPSAGLPTRRQLPAASFLL